MRQLLRPALVSFTTSSQAVQPLLLPDTEPVEFPAHTYQRVPSLLLNDIRAKRLIPTDIAVYALLQAHAQQKGWCYPGYQLLALEAACTVVTVKRSLARLEEAGHILRKSKAGLIFLLSDVTESKVVTRPKDAIISRKKARDKARRNDIENIPVPF